MGATSTIQWCDGTVNPTMGCDGCELWQFESKKNARRSCYAGLDHERKGGKSPGFAPTFSQVTRFPGRMQKAAKAPSLQGMKHPDKPWLDGMPRLWFVSDMSDALSRGVSFEYLATEVIEVVRSAEGRRHVWLWLTKQPRRMVDFSKYLGAGHWPSNLWAGTSITEPRYVDRVGYLREVGDESTTRFLSVEPQHDPISLAGKMGGVAWVIQGGESGRTKPPRDGIENYEKKLKLYNEQVPRRFDLAWARQLRDEYRKAKVAYFLKQLGALPVDGGKPVELRDGHGGDWNEWPDDLRVREVPGVTAGLR